MKLFTFFLISLSLLFLSCSKKTDTVSNKNSVQQNTQSASQGLYYTVKNITDAGGKNEPADFSWTENGQEKKLSDYKGKVVLLNFWATWCPPCKRELPDLSSLAKELSAKDFKIIGISVDENPTALDTYLKANALPYTILHEQGGLLNKYMSATGGDQNVIPQTFIIDKKGKIVEAVIGSRSKQDFLTLINKYL
jgi:peroxiredoxin